MQKQIFFDERIKLDPYLTPLQKLAQKKNHRAKYRS